MPVGRRIRAVGTGTRAVENVPAALGRRIFLRASRAHRGPICGHVIDLHADAPQEIGGHIALGLHDWHIGADQEDDWLALVAGLGQQPLGLIVFARALQDIATDLGIERSAGREKARQRLPERVVADDGLHIIRLA